jgi:thymidylate synthase (FAD)
MKIIPASFKILDKINAGTMLKNIESYGRVCYKSEKAVTVESADPFIRRLVKSGHESVIEHEKITVKFICDRGVTHEIVRHRIASYSQESTRYCNYAKDKFGSELTFIKPCFWDENSEAFSLWRAQMQIIEDNYKKLIAMGAAPEEARGILPNSLKTEIVVTMNLREWRHFFRLRASKAAHPQIREISIPLLEKMKELLPAVFDDIAVE